MKWTGLNQLREEFLSFFESKEHLRQPSASLVPHDDGSLLLINSGMAPLKNYFLGLETPPSKRVVNCQKCIRTPDIEEVGKTSRHGTYFEMLGNFSFGDYFKTDAIAWSLEFLLNHLKMPLDKLWFSIYEDDDEAFDIWTKNHDIDPSRVVRLGKEDNFWEIGAGPCGPCSEIHFDRGEKYGCNKPNCGVGTCDCDRYMEIWNLVFTQFNSDGKGTYTPLDHPNIDTGMGLERLACIMQDVDNLFEVDTMKSIMTKISDASGKAYKKNNKDDISLRVVTDHIRSTVFMIGDGVIPSNEGRGYVLRRLLRRAARHGKLLGISNAFLYKLCDTVIEENKDIYPELLTNAEYIKTVIKAEEDRFAKTIQQGIETLNQIIDSLETDAVIDGRSAFELYDTFGFPIDLTREIAEDRGVSIDEEGFVEYMQEQRNRARKAHQEQSGTGWEEDVLSTLGLKEEFVGYSENSTSSIVTAIVSDGKLTDSVQEGEYASIVLNLTPFYAESGGQIGDTGFLSSGDNVFKVTDTQKAPTGHSIHLGKVISGSIKSGETVTAEFDIYRRGLIMRNHTATHVLQAALRSVLGEHVHQAGSYVSDDIARFDFTHFSAVTPEELDKIENMVNRKIFDSIPVTIEEMSIKSAKEKGAIALFGDKYSDTVRVCSIATTSIELCGGTHVNNISQIGLVKILSESSVAAGVRRIEFVSSLGILAVLNRQGSRMKTIAKTLKINSLDELVPRAKTLISQLSAQENEINRLEEQLASSKTQNIEDDLLEVGPVKLFAMAMSGKIGPMQIKADELKKTHPNLVGVFIAIDDDRATALAFAGSDAIKAGIHSGNLIKEITAIAGGKGGGRPDNAKGGMPDIGKIDNAISEVKSLVKAQLKL